MEASISGGREKDQVGCSATVNIAATKQPGYESERIWRSIYGIHLVPPKGIPDTIHAVNFPESGSVRNQIHVSSILMDIHPVVENITKVNDVASMGIVSLV